MPFFTSGIHSYHFKPFLRVQLIVTILSAFYECALLLPSKAIFTSAPHSYYFKPILQIRLILTILSPLLRVRLILTILSYFYECASLLQF